MVGRGRRPTPPPDESDPPEATVTEVVAAAEPVEESPAPAPNGHAPGPVPAPRANGTAAAAAVAPVPGPKAPKRVRTVEIPEYPGFQVTVWVNYPSNLFDRMIDGDAEASLAAASLIFLQNNGWCDDEGNPYPPMNTQAFWDAIPNELAATMIAVLRQEVGKLPNSLLQRRER